MGVVYRSPAPISEGKEGEEDEDCDSALAVMRHLVDEERHIEVMIACAPKTPFFCDTDAALTPLSGLCETILLLLQCR